MQNKKILNILVHVTNLNMKYALIYSIFSIYATILNLKGRLVVGCDLRQYWAGY